MVAVDDQLALADPPVQSPVVHPEQPQLHQPYRTSPLPRVPHPFRHRSSRHAPELRRGLDLCGGPGPGVDPAFTAVPPAAPGAAVPLGRGRGAVRIGVGGAAADHGQAATSRNSGRLRRSGRVLVI